MDIIACRPSKTLESVIHFFNFTISLCNFFRKMAEFLNLTQLKTSLKETILFDYYTAGFWWAKEMNFSLIQISGFMGLLNFALENLSSKYN